MNLVKQTDCYYTVIGNSICEIIVWKLAKSEKDYLCIFVEYKDNISFIGALRLVDKNDIYTSWKEAFIVLMRKHLEVEEFISIVEKCRNNDVGFDIVNWVLSVMKITDKERNELWWSIDLRE